MSTQTCSQDYAWQPDSEIIASSNLKAFMRSMGVDTYEALLNVSSTEQERFWDTLLRHIDLQFYKPYTKIMDTSQGIPYTRWCVDGTTNLALNCIDKHRDTAAYQKTALLWDGENGEKRTLTYAQYDAEVCRFANALRELGIHKGDVVGLYMPMIPEVCAAFFAIAKVGAIVLPLFSGFGPQAIASRLEDAGAKAVITADGTYRRGQVVAMKTLLDEALEIYTQIERVIVVSRVGQVLSTPMQPGRDYAWEPLRARQPDTAQTEEMDAESICMLAFTSGTSGKAKGTVHTHCGFVSSVALDMGICMDFKPSDTFFWMSDFGWLIGALASVTAAFHGGSLLLAEGAPDYPDQGRLWRLVQDYQVSYFGIAPTAVRGAMRYGVEEVSKYDFSHLRITASSGEPWTDDAWLWFFEHVCQRKVPILNYSGGTEVGGGILGGTVLHPLKPSSFAGPLPGRGSAVFNEKGEAVDPGEVGELVMTQPSIGLTRSLYQDDARYIKSYWDVFPDVWVHGDWAMRDHDGMWYVLGRSDDTINVSGKRIGPSEIEGVLMSTGKILEAAMIGVPDALKGTALVCVCVANPGVETGDALRHELSQAIVEGYGASYRPKDILFVRDLPKTRSLKIMRRLIRSVYLDEPRGDTAALVNPEAVTELEHMLSPA